MGKQRQRHVQNHSQEHPVSVCVLQQNFNTVREIHCAVEEERRSRNGDAKSLGSVGGMETIIKGKKGICLFFPLSTKHRRLMQFHSQVWFTLAPFYYPRPGGG